MNVVLLLASILLLRVGARALDRNSWIAQPLLIAAQCCLVAGLLFPS
jgi:hypothetical protein